MGTSNYQRTIAGSVGAGMGALFNGSGRKYYIIEHKTTSKYHHAGDAQKIIVDQIEIGRDASCQVRFDEDFGSVSRRHAAIVREGDNWKLVHLSHSNPTFVNGQAINGTYYLQSGDEIQLAGNGPRFGFIIPQGSQSTTSSIRLTERMNLFRQQALRPYRRALWGMAALLLLVVLGLGFWNYKLAQQNQQLLAQAEQLIQQDQQLDQQIEDLNRQMRENPENENLRRQLEELQQQKQQVQTRYTTVYRDNPALQQEISALRAQVAGNGGAAAATAADNYDDEADYSSATSTASAPATGGAAQAAIRDYNDQIYTLKIRRITIEKDGVSIDPHISLSDVACGTGFLLSNGSFITARQNIEPWVFDQTTGVQQGSWRSIMRQYAAAGCNIIIEYEAYSTAGTAAKLSFNNQDFMIDRSGDTRVERIEIERSIRAILKRNSISVSYIERHYAEIRVFSPTSRCVAILPGAGGAGIPYNTGASVASEGGTDIQIAGFMGTTNIHNLSLEYFKSSTSRNDTQNGTIVLQSAPTSTSGYLGSPAFIKDSDGNYRLVGMYVGHFYGQSRLIPVARFNR